jgi:hypothetical protein
LKLRLDRKMFPFVPGGGELFVSKIAILFDADSEAEDDCSRPEIEGCPCPHRGEPARQVIEFSRERDEDYHRKEGYKHKKRYEREERYEGEEHRERQEHCKPEDRYEHREEYKRKERYEHKGDYKEHYEHKKDYDRDDRDCEFSVSCVASEAWPDLYCGMFDTHVGPLGRGRHRTVEFRFPCCVEVKRVFLLLRYTVEGREAGK